MKKTIVLSFLLVASVSLLSGFVWKRSSQNMITKMHVKALPEEGLIIVGPSDPSFEARLARVINGQPNDVVDVLKPASVFLENRGKRSVVAYMIQWCYTRADGTNDCYREAFAAPRALMEGEQLSEEEEARSGKIRPGSAVFLSLISPDGSGAFRVPISREEGEKFKQGLRPDRKELLQRFGAELAKCTDVTVSVDGAFFDDGTFVGDDTTGFFAQIKAQVDAKRDVLSELSEGTTKALKPRDMLFRDLEAIANQQTPSINSKSLPTDYYNYYRRHYAAQILKMREVLGDEKTVESALRPIKKPWRVLAKKYDKTASPPRNEE